MKPKNKTFDIEIVESITETRTYSIPAKNKKEAAAKAYEAWIVNGEDAGGQVSVDSRSYYCEGEEIEVEED